MSLKSNQPIRTQQYLQLGEYPITEVLVVTLITTLLAYPNPYTRIGASAMIDELFQECGPIDNNNLCDYQKVVSF